MKDNMLFALKVVFILVLIGPVMGLIGFIVGAVLKAISKIYYRFKFRKGIKNGEIVKINGEYYEVSVDH